MAVIKCKMCGGDLQVIEGESVCECEYCGSRQTVPSADNEKKMTLFSRASRLLRNCEFDKAASVFENIVADFPEEGEAYWCLVLCKYGIEYVNDPNTGKKIPTCHRSSFDSVLDDSNFEQACENSDTVARRVYRDEARAIEELRKGIIEVSGKEEPYDVFISYKETDENGDRTLDSVIAQDIYSELTEKGYRVFFSRISLEGKLGVEYEPYIFAALNSAKVMIVVGTDYENFDAVWVKNEWSRFLKLIASGQKKILIPVFKNMDAYDMPKEFSKLSAQDMGKVGAMQDLIRGVEKLLGKKNAQTSEATVAPVSDPGISMLNAQTSALLKRGYMMLADGDYAKADDFFEKVLSNDAECGQAYLGKALAQAKVPNAEKYGEMFLIKRLKEQEEVKTITLPVESIVSLARKVDENGILKDFSDRELAELLKDLDYARVQYQSALPFYRQKDKQYSEASALHKLAGSPDFDRASKYSDDVVREAEHTVLSSFRARLATEIWEEEKKEANARQLVENKKSRIIATIKSRLSEVSGIYQRQQEMIETERKMAEEQAEKDYQYALAKYERDYRMAVAAQQKAYEAEVKLWEKRKEDYVQNYDSVNERIVQLKEKIAELEGEKNNLNGIFMGRKRKELEEKISVLRKKVDETVIPEDPGEKPKDPDNPEIGKLPQRGDFKKALESNKNRNTDLNELIKCSLSPEYKRVCEAIKNLKRRKVGDEIPFGRYEIVQGKMAPISWIVLARDNNRLLVISKYALDCKQYNENSWSVTWSTCTLRKWLNKSFLNKAFNPSVCK